MLHQREQLEGAAGQVQETQEVTKRAHQKITELRRRLQREKWILTAIVVVLVIINMLIIYRLATNHGSF